jgi:hypothetical protein
MAGLFCPALPARRQKRHSTNSRSWWSRIKGNITTPSTRTKLCVAFPLTANINGGKFHLFLKADIQ